MWVVHFRSESGDDYYANFNRKPTEEELKTYMVQNFSFEIEDNTCYVHVSSVEEVTLETPWDDPESYKDIEWL